jgi:hypothetical protein
MSTTFVLSALLFFSSCALCTADDDIVEEMANGIFIAGLVAAVVIFGCFVAGAVVRGREGIDLARGIVGIEGRGTKSNNDLSVPRGPSKNREEAISVSAGTHF